MDFREFTINRQSVREFQLIISNILGHRNQKLPRKFQFKYSLSISLLKELIVLWRLYMNITNCVGITIYWSETIFIISLKKNIVYLKHLLEVMYLPHLKNFRVKELIVLGLFKFKFLKFIFKAICYINNAMVLL